MTKPLAAVAALALLAAIGVADARAQQQQQQDPAAQQGQQGPVVIQGEHGQTQTSAPEAVQEQQGQVTAEDREFLTTAIQAGLAEVQLARLALETAKDEQVRAFAERMVEEHTAANVQLMNLAETAGLTPPTAMDQRHQDLHRQLSELAGAEFDRRYMQGQVQDHRTAMELYATEVTQPSGPVDELAGRLLPALREHLEMAQRISQALT
jgi:putative membrane protein